MIADLILAAALMVHTDPLDAALDYHTNLTILVEQIERQEEREQALELERQQAIDRASRDTERSPLPGSSELPGLLLTIRANESGGDYGAVNPDGCERYGCFGAYQMHGLYAPDWARRYGASAYAGTPPSNWPPQVQDRVALGLFYSTTPDGAHWCDWTAYC